MVLTATAAMAAACGCKRKKPAAPPPPAETAITVTVTGQVDQTGEFEKGGFCVGEQEIAGKDLGGLAAAIRAARDAAAAKGTKKVTVRILVVPATPYGVVRRIVAAAAKAQMPELSLACVEPGSTAKRGMRFRLPASGPAAGGEPVEVRVWPGPAADEAIYGIVETGETCRDARVLKPALAARQEALDAAGAILLRPADAVPAHLVAAAMTAAMEAGFTRVLFAAEPMLAEAPKLPKPKPIPEDDEPIPTGPRPPSRFAGAGGEAYNVVYLIDRSGSMAATFEQVRQELIKSIGGLKPEQHFHVILFGGHQPRENPGGKLIPADEANRKAAIEFIRTVSSSGVTQGIPAIRRAFDVLGEARPSRPGKLIYLLTDGEFRYENLRLNDKVLAEIRSLNADKKVIIHTLLYGKRTQAGEEILRTIAAENGGRYRYINPEE